MKSLLSRLKPEIMEVIEKDREQYPLMVEALLRNLNEAEFTLNLSVGDAYNLVVYFEELPEEIREVKWGFKNESFLMKLYECFNENPTQEPC